MVPAPIQSVHDLSLMSDSKSDAIAEIDCMDVFDWLSRMGGASVDMALVDPPYGVTRNAWDQELDIACLLLELSRVLKPGGTIAMFGGGMFMARAMLAGEAMWRYNLTWVKSKSTNFLNAKHQPLRRSETIMLFQPKVPAKYNPLMFPGEAYDKGVRKTSDVVTNYGEFKGSHVKRDKGRYATDVIYAKTAEGERVDKQLAHPTQKPVVLLAYLMATYCPRGGVVVDPCCGTGATGVAAQFMRPELAPSLVRMVDFNEQFATAAATRCGVPLGRRE